MKSGACWRLATLLSPSYSVVHSRLSLPAQMPTGLASWAFAQPSWGRLANLDWKVVSCDIHISWQEAPRLQARMGLYVPGKRPLWEAEPQWHFCTSGISPQERKNPLGAREVQIFATLPIRPVSSTHSEKKILNSLHHAAF